MCEREREQRKAKEEMVGYNKGRLLVAKGWSLTNAQRINGVATALKKNVDRQVRIFLLTPFETVKAFY